MHNRFALGYQGLALTWYAFKHKRRRISVKSDGGVVRVDDGTRQILVPHVRYATHFRDGIRPRIEQVAQKYMGETTYVPRPDETVIDVGAGIGEFSLWCAEAGARVIAFEPDPLAFECLQRNTALQPGTQVFPYALWKDRSNLRLHASLDTSESSLIEDGKGSGRNMSVETLPLDRLQFMIRMPVIDLMKIDGEGVEPEIIAGAVRTLMRTRVVVVDVGATARRPNLRTRVETALREINFRFVPNGRDDTLLALNTAMVGPVSNRILDRQRS